MPGAVTIRIPNKRTLKNPCRESTLKPRRMSSPNGTISVRETVSGANETGLRTQILNERTAVAIIHLTIRRGRRTILISVRFARSCLRLD